MRRPWYGFLYYALGAQGSFFAWVVALLGIYVTWQEALLWALNPQPRDAHVVEIFADEPHWRRWVRVGGVEIDLASALFAARPGEAAGAPPGSGRIDRIVIDREDPAALAWRALFKEIETARGKLDPGGGGANDAELKRLRGLIAAVRSERERYIPERALAVIARDPAGEVEPASATRTASAASPGGAATDGDEMEAWRRDMRARIDLVRASVRDNVDREGFLEPLKEETRAFYRAQYGVTIAGSALSVGHRPSTLAAELFGVFAVTLLFLVVGLRGGGGTA